MYYLCVAGPRKPDPNLPYPEHHGITTADDRLFLIEAESPDVAAELLAVERGVDRRYLVVELDGFTIDVRASSIVQKDPAPAAPATEAPATSPADSAGAPPAGTPPQSA